MNQTSVFNRKISSLSLSLRSVPFEVPPYFHVLDKGLFPSVFPLVQSFLQYRSVPTRKRRGDSTNLKYDFCLHLCLLNVSFPLPWEQDINYYIFVSIRPGPLPWHISFGSNLRRRKRYPLYDSRLECVLSSLTSLHFCPVFCNFPFILSRTTLNNNLHSLTDLIYCYQWSNSLMRLPLYWVTGNLRCPRHVFLMVFHKPSLFPVRYWRSN